MIVARAAMQGQELPVTLHSGIPSCADIRSMELRGLPVKELEQRSSRRRSIRLLFCYSVKNRPLETAFMNALGSAGSVVSAAAFGKRRFVGPARSRRVHGNGNLGVY